MSFPLPIAFYKFLASNLLKNIVEKLLYAYWQGESRAYLFMARAWGNEMGIMGWDSTPFGEENPEPTGNGMGHYVFWRGESRAYGQWDGALSLLARRIPCLCVYGEGLGQWDGTLHLLARRIPSLRVYC